MSKVLAEQRRKEILAAARRCFIARGLHATSMTHIAKEFGMSAGHIYNYFPSKTAIIEAIVQEGMDEFYASHANFLECQGDYEKVIKHVQYVFKHLFVNERLCLSLEILAAAHHDPLLQKVVHESDRAVRHYLRELSAQYDADDSRLVDARVDMLMAQFEGIGLRKLRNPEMDVEKVAELLAERISTPRAALKARLKAMENRD